MRTASSSEAELGRLHDLMPASGRMFVRLLSKPGQRQLIAAEFPRPWQRNRAVTLNLDLWQQLSQPQRDLLMLRTVSWLLQIQWFKPDVYQGATVVGLLGTLIELSQGDLMGLVAAAGLTGLAGLQVWRLNRSDQREVDADLGAIKVAIRRGYQEAAAAEHLLGAIEAQALLEGQRSLTFIELLRCQKLKTMTSARVTL
ncbi:MAG: DUF3318 domain-containing protein [Cyanobacteria bacterium P01_H01_bin.121]